MECKVCGRAIQNENANFCDYCGTALKDRGQVVEPNLAEERKQIELPFQQPDIQAQRNQSWTQETTSAVKEEKPLSFWIFFGVMVVGLIPGIGLLIQVAILAALAFGKQMSKVAKNWSRAFLLFNLISFFVSSYILMPLLESIMRSVK